MKKTVRMSQAGFSLVELMVVVAIIGILATIAIPQVSKFQAKARQTEAKTTLSNIFTAEKGFFVEWSGYHTDLRTIGAAVEGQNMRYKAGFPAGACAASAGINNYPAGTGVNDTATAGAFSAGSTFWNGATVTGLGMTAAITGAACDNTAGAQVFHAQARGYPGSQVATSDDWEITDSKILSNLQNGIL